MSSLSPHNQIDVDEADEDIAPSVAPPTISFKRAQTLPVKTPVHEHSYLRLQTGHNNHGGGLPTPDARSPATASRMFRSPLSASAAASPMRSFTTPWQTPLPIGQDEECTEHEHTSERPPLSHLHVDRKPTQLYTVERADSMHTPQRGHSMLAVPNTSIATSVTSAAAAAASAMEDIPSRSTSPPLAATLARMLVGAVIGKVTTNTARVLIEVDTSIQVTATLTPQLRWYRPPLSENTVADAASSPESVASPKGKRKEPSSSPTEIDEAAAVKKQKLSSSLSLARSPSSEIEDDGVAEKMEQLNTPDPSKPVLSITLDIEAYTPTVFAFKDLQPETIYLVEFSSTHLSPKEMCGRTGLFRTMSLDPTKEIKFIAFSCDCASEVGRGVENLWKKLYIRSCATLDEPTFDVMLHIGDQVYADAAFAKGEEIFGVTEQKPQEGVDGVIIENEYSALSEDEKSFLVLQAYQEIYRHTWSDIPTRYVLATGSHLTIWDDHELRNDWGSFAPSKIDLIIAQQARKAFHLYQRQLWDDAIIPSLIPRTILPDEATECSFHTYGQTGVLIMDNRACKTWDPTCSLFPLPQAANLTKLDKDGDQTAMDESVPTTSSAIADPSIPHAHAYFGASQWKQLYKCFGSTDTASSPNTPAPIASNLTALIVINPSPAFFLGSNECDRLTDNVCLLDKLGLGLHAEEQGNYIELIRQWKFGSLSQPRADRQVLFIGGDSHFGCHSTIWTVPPSIPGGSDDPRVIGSGSVLGPAHAPVPSGLTVLFDQVLASALSSRRPKYSSFELWKLSLWKDHCLRGSTPGIDANDSDAAASTFSSSSSVGPFYVTHDGLLYAHNFVEVRCQPSNAHTIASSIDWNYVTSDAHEKEMRELETKMEQK